MFVPAPLLLAMAAAFAPDGKLAVVILPGSPRAEALADNVTEVVVAHLAARGAVEIVGTPELLRRVGLTADVAARSCIDDPSCLDGIAVALGVKWIVTGVADVRASGEFLFNLALRDVERGRVRHRVSDSVDGSVETLVRRVRAATDTLLEPPPPEPRPRLELALAPVPQPPALVELPRGATPRRRWPTYAAVGTGAGAALSLAGGAVLGSIALFGPLSGNRAEAQRQFEDRQRLGGIADGLLVAGAALAAVSIGLTTLIVMRR